MISKAKERLIQSLTGSNEKVFYAISLQTPTSVQDIIAELKSQGINAAYRNVTHALEDLVNMKIVKKMAGNCGPASHATFIRLAGPPRNKPELSVVKKSEVVTTPTTSESELKPVTVADWMERVRHDLDQLELLLMQHHEELEHEKLTIEEERKELNAFKSMIRKFTTGD